MKHHQSLHAIALLLGILAAFPPALLIPTVHAQEAKDPGQWERYETPGQPGKFGFKYNVHNEASASFSNRSAFEVSFTQSSQNLVYENASFKNAVDTLDLKNLDFIVSFNLRISFTPWLLQGRVEDQLGEKLDNKLKLIRRLQLETVRGKINAGLEQDPAYRAASPVMKQKIFDKFMEDATRQVDGQLNMYRRSKMTSIEHRIKKITFETSIQEVAIVVGKVVGDGKGLVFLRVGKFHIENGPKVDENGQSELENLRNTNSRIQRGGGSFGTGAIDLGYATKINDDLKLRTDFYLFHSRLPHIDANGDVAQFVSQDEDAFQEHTKFWKLDSVGFRMLLESKAIDLYLGAASHRGEGTVNAGAVIRITENDTVFIDAFKGDREFLGAGVAVFYAHKFTKQFSVYGGFSHLEESWEPLISATPIGYNEVAVGASFEIFSRELRNGALLQVKLNAEVAKRWYKDENPYSDEMIYRAGIELELSH